ncbi:MAG: hypothetical protein SGARI_004518, partial [Bacillariaceae sp.]
MTSIEIKQKADTSGDEVFANHPFRSVSPIWVNIAEFMGYEGFKFSALRIIPELQGLSEYLYAQQQSKRTHGLIRQFGHAMQDLAAQPQALLHSFGARCIEFNTVPTFYKWCRAGGFDPETM